MGDDVRRPPYHDVKAERETDVQRRWCNHIAQTNTADRNQTRTCFRRSEDRSFSTGLSNSGSGAHQTATDDIEYTYANYRFSMDLITTGSHLNRIHRHCEQFVQSQKHSEKRKALKRKAK
ncbi:hypothetical protein EVAR_19493_1 [Eumeta japonica]|uniref:Uncharacterized protein n=1 Tax=Eumeta variegata TaxID=151549 RepID=A0A4C1VA40_EUMVA|nr:hypothetical protein EVAR_19493_1 [Eumeta japonica]